MNNHHHYLVWEHFHYPQKKPQIHRQSRLHSSPSLPALSNHWSTFCLSTLNLFGHFLVMTSCISVCSLSIMFSRLIHSVACISISSIFIAEYDSIVWIYSILLIHSPVDECWVVSTFWLLWIILLWTFMLKCLCEHILSVLLGFYLGVEFLGLMVTLCLTF